MSLFPEVRRRGLAELEDLFKGNVPPEIDPDGQELWLQEVATQLARKGARGIDFLLLWMSSEDEPRLRAALVALSFVASKLSSRKRAQICEQARRLLGDKRKRVVAEAVDALSRLECPSAEQDVYPLLAHESPYVSGSAVRFVARRLGKEAAPLLLRALQSQEPIVRQNAVDELDEMNYLPALPQIRQLLQDPDEDVRQAARTAVAHFEEDSSRR
jgi:HEAT repeat protein